MAEQFALLAYSTNNLGDEIQSIAARQFLPSVDLLIDRDDWTTVPTNPEGMFKIILNGWFTRYSEQWPPPDLLLPLPVSMHITRERNASTAQRAPAQALLEGAALAYLQRHQPIGCRDLWTVQLLRQHGVDSFFSGCVTLTLGAGPVARGNYICAVDLADEMCLRLMERAQTPIVRLHHRDTGGGSFQQRCAKAKRLLSLYAQAKCVVTTRLHCALPSIAFGTPTLFVNNLADQYRLEGLVELMRSCSPEAFVNGEVNFDFDSPGENNDAYIPLRQQLITRLQGFTGATRRPFAVTPFHQIDIEAALAPARSEATAQR
jgi:hypothetical protein